MKYRPVIIFAFALYAILRPLLAFGQVDRDQSERMFTSSVRNVVNNRRLSVLFIPIEIKEPTDTNRLKDWIHITSWDAVINSCLTEHPQVISDALKKEFPKYNAKLLIERARRGTATDSQENTVSVHLAPTSSTYGSVLQLVFNPQLSLTNESYSDAQVQTILRSLRQDIVENLSKVLPDFSAAYITKQLAERRENLQKELQALQNHVASAHDVLDHNVGMPSEKFSEQLAEISRQQITVKLSLVGMEAREQAIAKEIAQTQQKMFEKTASDDTVKNLEHLLQLRTERLERLKKMRDTGAVPATDEQTAEADVLTAKIELDKSRAALKRANGGEQLDAWNNELSHIAIDRAETEARLKFLAQAGDETTQQLRDRRYAEGIAAEAQTKLATAVSQLHILTNQLEQLTMEQGKIEPLRVVLPDEPDDNIQPSLPVDANSSKNGK
ncbi:MAG TPA: hypothetical protein VFE46_04345 [Pirellulales bacterium]|jgi:hypothetical protein|nr:hypothetical protein [Pirellulales bacterium]